MAYDFPASPAENQEFTPPGGPTYVYKAPRWTAKPAPTVVGLPVGGTTGQVLTKTSATDYATNWLTLGAIVETIITSSTTYTKSAGLRYLDVTIVAGGGGGGYSRSGAGACAVGSGGGGGGAAKVLLAAVDVAASTPITIGAAGAGGIGATPVGATNGGSSSFGTQAVANGGFGGGSSAASTAALTVQGAAGGVGTTGPFLTRGNDGDNGVIIGLGAFQNSAGGGGNSLLAGGGGGGIHSNGRNGQHGSGGGGTGDCNSTRNGGAGGAGLCILREYF